MKLDYAISLTGYSGITLPIQTMPVSPNRMISGVSLAQPIFRPDDIMQALTHVTFKESAVAVVDNGSHHSRGTPSAENSVRVGVITAPAGMNNLPETNLDRPYPQLDESK